MCVKTQAPIQQTHIVQHYTDKDSRIMTLGGYLSRRQIRIVDDRGGRELIAEGRDWPNADYDDCLDALEMALRYAPIKISTHTPEEQVYGTPTNFGKTDTYSYSPLTS